MFQRIVFLASLFTLLSCSIVRAGVSVDISLAPVTDPIQNFGIYNVGDTVTANIFLQVDGLGLPVSTSLSAYNFSLRFDPTMLGFVNLSQIKTTFAGSVSTSLQQIFGKSKYTSSIAEFVFDMFPAYMVNMNRSTTHSTWAFSLPTALTSKR